MNEVMDLVVYNGKLYAATIPLAEVYRYEADGDWTSMGSLVQHPEWDIAEANSQKLLDRACRVSCFSVYQGSLYAGTGWVRGIASADRDHPFGRVFSMEAARKSGTTL